MTETQKRIKAYQAALPDLKERVLAVALLLVVSLTMMTSATFAWLTISRAPEVTGVSTTVAANGNLEIALVGSDGAVPDESKVGDSSAAQGVTLANVTWGNLVNLSDASYGLENIVLRPALLGNTNNLLDQPLKGVDYGLDGRVELYYNEDFQFTNWVLPADGLGYFEYKDPAQYGVRAVSTVKYEYKNNTFYQYTQMMSEVSREWETVKGLYDAMLSNEDYIDALAGLIGKFMTDKLNDKNGSTDIASYIPTVYDLLVEFKGIAMDFSDVLVALANTQVYNHYGPDAYGIHTYQWDDIFTETNGRLSADTTTFKDNGVSLTCLTEYLRLVNAIDAVLYGDHVSETATAYDAAGNVVRADGAESFADYMYRIEQAGGYKNTTVQFLEVTDLINDLVNISACQIVLDDGTTYTVGGIGMSAATKLLGKDVDARITKGILKDFEQLTGYKMYATEVDVSATYLITVTMTARTITTTAAPDYKFEIDRAATQAAAEGNKGDYTGVAQDTYGLAIDLWVRTNIADSYLMLEGNVLTKSEEVDATGKDADGNTVNLYSLPRTVTTWYKADDHSLFTLESGESPERVSGSTVTNAEGEEVQEYTLSRDGTSISLYQVSATAELTLYQGTAEDTKWYDASNSSHPEFQLLETDNAPKATEDKITVNGTEYTVYELVRRDENNNPTTYQIYPVVTERAAWFNAETYDEVTLQGNETPLQKKETITTVIGYEGENRVWDEDYQENIWLSTDSTTQGSGSCYVFYAEDPGQQENCLRLLANLRVGFIDADPDSATYGKLIAAGKLDIENRFEESGKVTLPLVLYDDGSPYLTKTENGMAVMPLEKNKATRLMVIVYLDGREISNSDVLAANDIQGRLNLQFGTSEALVTAGDSALESAVRSVTAMSKAASDTGDYSGNQTIQFSYDTASEDNPMTVNVKVTVTGEQPTSLTGFFMRQVSSTQGSRESEFSFVPYKDEGGNWIDGEGVWIGSYTFTAPGNYVMRTVCLDGVDYDLPAGTDGESGYPNVSVSGFAIESVIMSYNSVAVNPVQTIMTSERSVSADLSVKLASGQAKLPSSVRLQFVKTEDKSQVTTTMSYDATTATWKGTAGFSSSGEYTLLYVIMDGEYFAIPETMQRVITMYIGMTVKVWDDGTEREFTNDYGESETKTMYVEIYDNEGNKITHLSGAKLIYMSAGVRALDTDLKWDPNEKCYTGRFQIVNPGIYTFGAVTITSGTGENAKTSYLTNTTEEPPTFSCFSPDPPEYIGTGSESEANDYILDTGTTDTDVYLDVEIANAQGATVNAVLTNSENSGTTYTVKGALADGSTTRFRFLIPKDSATGYQVGNWTITTLKLHNVYDENKDFRREDNPIVWTLDTAAEDLHVKIVKVKVTLTGDDQTISGKDFLESAATTEAITVTITDHNGDPLDFNYITIGSMNGDQFQTDQLRLNYYYVYNTSEDNGGYSFNESETTTGLGGTYTMSGSEGVYTLSGVDLTYAGVYQASTLTLKIKETGLGESDATTLVFYSQEYAESGTSQDKILDMPVYTLKTEKPMVKVTGVSPAKGLTFSVNAHSAAASGGGFTEMSGVMNTFTDYNAVVFMQYTGATMGMWRWYAEPSVELTLSGMPSTFENASITFNHPTAAYARTYTFTPGDGLVQTNEIGHADDPAIDDANPKLYFAGTQTVDAIEVKYNSMTFEVDLFNAVTINQPRYPAVVSFQIDDETFNGTLPAPVPGQNEQTVTLTLPSVSWYELTQATGDPVIGTYTVAEDLCTEIPGAKYTRSWVVSGFMGLSSHWEYTPYTQHITVEKAPMQKSGVGTIYTVTKWNVNGQIYEAGTEVKDVPDGTVIEAAEVMTTTGQVTVNLYSVKTTYTYTVESVTESEPAGERVDSAPTTEVVYTESFD